MKRYTWIPAVILGSLLLLASLGWGFSMVYKSNLRPVTDTPAEQQVVDIKSGTSSHQISRELQDKGLVRSAWALQWYMYKNGISSQIQAGLYRFSPQQPASEIAQMLADGDTAARSLTITGGMRLGKVKEQLRVLGYSDEQINTALSTKYDYSVLADKPPDISLEGYLFPDTYRVEEGSSATAVVDLILANTEDKVTPELRQAWAARGLNINQALSMASIIQQEASNPEDQRVIAQVFYKRLAIHMKLESDVTFLYAAYLLDTTPSVSVNSPYNTYIADGLPPGPIAAVEQSAMEAVANPAATDYLYFLADKEGNTHFSTDKAGHEENIQKYLQ